MGCKYFGIRYHLAEVWIFWYMSPDRAHSGDAKVSWRDVKVRRQLGTIFQFSNPPTFQTQSCINKIFSKANLPDYLTKESVLTQKA